MRIITAMLAATLAVDYRDNEVISTELGRIDGGGMQRDDDKMPPEAPAQGLSPQQG